MAVSKSTDQKLRKLGSNDRYTIVFYYQDNCFYCSQLGSTYEKLSEDAEFSEIHFLKIPSVENPVAKTEVHNKRMPFISIYKQGLLLECGCVRSEKGLLRFLEKLKKRERRSPSNFQARKQESSRQLDSMEQSELH